MNDSGIVLCQDYSLAQYCIRRSSTPYVVVGVGMGVPSPSSLAPRGGHKRQECIKEPALTGPAAQLPG